MSAKPGEDISYVFGPNDPPPWYDLDAPRFDRVRTDEENVQVTGWVYTPSLTHSTTQPTNHPTNQPTGNKSAQESAREATEKKTVTGSVGDTDIRGGGTASNERYNKVPTHKRY